MDMEKTRTLRNYAYTAGKLGMTQTAQEYAGQAYDAFIGMHEYGWASLCLYERCIAYHSIGDTVHTAALMEELKTLAGLDTSALTQYNYYSVLLAWHMWREDAQAAAQAGRRSIWYMERIPDLQQYNIMPVWNYYNQALVFDMLYSPPMTDSIAYYLALAESSAQELIKRVDYQEAMISIGDERAWLHYYNKEYVRAENTMLEVLKLIDTVALASPATVCTERCDAYAFLVELFEAQQRHEDALRYQQLLTECNKQRYDIERQRVLDEVQTRYEVAQKELAIEREKRKNGRIVGGLACSLLLASAVGVALLAVWYRKKRTEEALYAKALEAENMYNELRRVREDSRVEPLELLRNGLLQQIAELPMKTLFKADALRRVRELDLSSLRTTIAGVKGLSVMDKRYLLCFMAGVTPEQTADIFNISPASVYTVRYRIRKKFPREIPFVW